MDLIFSQLEVKALNDFGVPSHLDIGTPAKLEAEPVKQDIPAEFNFFVTIAFPTNKLYKIKHSEYKANGDIKIVFSDIKYGDCTPSEQYKYIHWVLSKHIKSIASDYDIFFEVTKEGNIHFHGRLKSHMSKRTLKIHLHRMFDTDSKYKHFCDLKEYNDKLWNDYDTKKTKNYQTTEIPHFKNI